MLFALPRAARCQQPGLATATAPQENEPPRRACGRAEGWAAHSDPHSGSWPPETTSPRLPGAGGSRGRGGGTAQEPLSAILWSTRRGRLFSCARRRRLPRRLPPAARAAARAAAPAEPSPAEAAPSAFSFSRRCSLLTTVIRAGPAGILPPRWPHTSVACPLSRTSNLSGCGAGPGILQRWAQLLSSSWGHSGKEFVTALRVQAIGLSLGSRGSTCRVICKVTLLGR
ncbi:eukaryotic translation initiation factor 1b isoform X1 [Manis pentadactyla]|uniref:eukaryotic translation initiation factor 1b isoform X1 n=1 Tax=Manis pentadactyla TaxID=143292 RepID=UPI00255C8C43|nr:eukaryotic translation initiation factor 1b isoform X1 [Manis pentadactyla]